MSHNLDRDVGRESDGRVLPTKCPNKGGSSTPAESTEGRRPTKENTGQTAASQIQSWENALAGLHRVREAAKREKRLQFTALLHHVSVALLSNSFYALKREAAPGVDGLTWQEYETDLDKRLEASLRSFRLEVRKRWLRVIRRRSQRSGMTWELMDRFAAEWLPEPKILHPHPYLRFDAKYLR